MLVAYFSHSGNTRTVAQAISEATGADLFEIIPQQDYPTDYSTLLDVAKREINAHKHPELKERVKDFEAYDVIFIGSPNWWSTTTPALCCVPPPSRSWAPSSGNSAPPIPR